MASVSDTLSYAKKFSGYDYNKMVKAGMRSGNPNFWCADFVAFVLSKKGVKTGLGSSSQQFINMSGWHSVSSGYSPKKGDVFVLKNKSNSGGHTGFVTSDGYPFKTIEGNSGGKVRTGSYNKGGTGNQQLLGFWTPQYSNSNSNSSSSSSSKKKELSSKKIVSVSGAEGIKKQLFNADGLLEHKDYYELYIKNSEGTIFRPAVQDGVQWSTGRTGTPGRLSFSVFKDNVISFKEGDAVLFKVAGDGVFYGYVFTKQRSKNETIQVTAYDQLRYFANKDTYIFTKKRADEMLTMIANDYKLVLGNIDNTKYVIPTQIEDNSTLFDIIETAIETTYKNIGARYLLFDDFGSLQLKSVKDFVFNLMISDETIEDYSYSSSIDKDTYNRIELYKDTDSGSREIKVYQDGNSISSWGMLKYTASYGDDDKPDTLGKQLLENYNRVSRKLSVKNVFGDIRVRAGSQIYVKLNIGDVNLECYMMVDSATHTFKGDRYTMDLTLIKQNMFSA